MFVNQSFWQTGVSAKPGQSVWGFLSGGLVWFAIPFCSAFALGMTYWAFTIQTGGHVISDSHVMNGRVKYFLQCLCLCLVELLLCTLYDT